MVFPISAFGENFAYQHTGLNNTPDNNSDHQSCASPSLIRPWLFLASTYEYKHSSRCRAEIEVTSYPFDNGWPHSSRCSQTRLASGNIFYFVVVCVLSTSHYDHPCIRISFLGVCDYTCRILCSSCSFLSDRRTYDLDCVLVISQQKSRLPVSP